ncbi:MAG: hypothetical protein ACPGPG_05045 [Luminiphilus sp.]|jgi:hypothetical protein
MDAIDERFAVYTAIIFICSAVGALAGGFAATATFAVIASGVELAYWLGRVIEDSGHAGAAS